MINVNQDAESNLPNKNSGGEVTDEIHKLFKDRNTINDYLSFCSEKRDLNKFDFP